MNDSTDAGHPAVLLPRRVRWVPLAVFAAFAAVGLTRMYPNPPVAVGAAVVAVGAAALLVGTWRRWALGYVAVATAGVAVLGNGRSSDVGWFAVVILGGWCALIGARRDALVSWAGSEVLFLSEWFWVQRDPGWGAWMVGTAVAVLASLLIRHEVGLVAQLRGAQAGLAERAKTDERNRIARELHDVIAHTLTISLLHVTSARLAVEYDPADASRALAEAERLSRESLDEVRTAMGALRPYSGSGSGPTTPLPGASGLPALVDRFRSVGADVTLTVHGQTEQLPATTGLAVYRIMQEALTNAIKHAPGASTAAILTVDSAGVGLIVDSAGEPGSGRGLGTLSMRERAEALGGTCRAGPGGRGWLVQARLPLDPARRRETAT